MNGRWGNRWWCEQARSGYRRAFTVIELIVVIAVMLIVASLLLPAISKSKERGNSAACLSNLRQIGLSLQMYLQENDNQMPFIYDAGVVPDPSMGTNPVSTIDQVLSNHLGNLRVLLCPSDGKQLFALTRSSYSWNNLVNGQDAEHMAVFSIELAPPNIPLVYDKEAFHRALGKIRAVNYLYADGHSQNFLAIEGTTMTKRRRR